VGAPGTTGQQGTTGQTGTTGLQGPAGPGAVVKSLSISHSSTTPQTLFTYEGDSIGVACAIKGLKHPPRSISRGTPTTFWGTETSQTTVDKTTETKNISARSVAEPEPELRARQRDRNLCVEHRSAKTVAFTALSTPLWSPAHLTSISTSRRASRASTAASPARSTRPTTPYRQVERPPDASLPATGQPGADVIPRGPRRETIYEGTDGCMKLLITVLAALAVAPAASAQRAPGYKFEDLAITRQVAANGKPISGFVSYFPAQIEHCPLLRGESSKAKKKAARVCSRRISR